MKIVLRNANFELIILEFDLLTQNEKAIKQIKLEFPRVKFIAISHFVNPFTLMSYLKFSLNGIITKNIDPQELSHAIKAVLANKTYISNEINEVYNEFRSKPEFIIFHNNSRVLEVLFLLSHQYCSKEIAYMMNISEKTVEKYRKQLFEITGVRNVVGLAYYAFQNNYHLDTELINKFRINNRLTQSYLINILFYFSELITL